MNTYVKCGSYYLIKTIDFYSAHYKKGLYSPVEAVQYNTTVLIPEVQFSFRHTEHKQTLRHASEELKAKSKRNN